jgi:hypothetical protein
MPDLTKFQVGALPLTLGDLHFLVKPPSSVRGVMLTRVVTMGLQAGLTQTDFTEDSIAQILGADTVEMLSEDKDFGLEKLALGDDTFQQMFDADIPTPDIRMCARYSAYFWVFGKKVAEDIMENELKERDGQVMPEPTDVELPKL